jgi:hypothetical protein
MQSKLVAFKVSRRFVTVAVFSGQNLDYVDIQHLSNVPKVAVEALERFVGWVVENFHPEIAALAVDAEETDQQLRAQMLTESAEKYLLQQGVPIWKTTDSQLLESYAVPAVANKHELRQIARSMWPYVGSQHVPALDAALVGLFVQTERILSKH